VGEVAAHAVAVQERVDRGLGRAGAADLVDEAVVDPRADLVGGGRVAPEVAQL
jgi:hypothetical protein